MGMVCGNCGRDIPDMNYYNTKKGQELLQKKADLERQLRELDVEIKNQEERCPHCNALIIRG